ncbi:MAG: hypothetical protein JO271_18210 [Verrucomicrobia bacterium]|nr:hypothetical protein [Verrucomicrobiota bacterium]
MRAHLVPHIPADTQAFCCGRSGFCSRYTAARNHIDHAGPITRTVDDAAFMLQVMAGFDALDPGSIEVPIPMGA